MNLASETIEKLAQHEYNIDDIEWIGNRYYTIPIHEFFDVARKTEYYNGYGSPEIPCDLIIKMKDGSWYSRGEYDGSEWWQYNYAPEKPNLHRHLKVKSFVEIKYNWDPTLDEACGIRR